MWSEERGYEGPPELDNGAELIDPENCPDRAKPRPTVAQYAALLSTQVACNLEGIAGARLERRPRQYQSDASSHQAYMKATTGGGLGADGEADMDSEDLSEAPQEVRQHFEPLPWDISSEEDMQSSRSLIALD